MCHEAMSRQHSSSSNFLSGIFNALSDSLQHAHRLQNKGRQHHSTQIRAWSQLRNDMRQH